MNITISRTARGLKLSSLNPHYRKYVNTHLGDYKEYHDLNYTGYDIYCYDMQLFQVMCKLVDGLIEITNDGITFDVE